MPIIYGPTDLLTTIIWTSTNFATGGGTTNFSWRMNPGEGVGSEGIAEQMATAATGVIAPELDSDFRIERIRWETAAASGEVEVGTQGTRSGTGPPVQVATLCALKGLGKGRRNNGRQFWPGLLTTTNVSEAGLITESRRDQIQTMVDAFVSATTTTTLAAQAISQSETPGQQSPPIVPWPLVSSRVVSPRTATQRRRVRP